jgi:hypothetical protein
VRAERHAAQEPRLGAELAAEALDARLRRERGLDVGFVNWTMSRGPASAGKAAREASASAKRAARDGVRDAVMAFSNG